MFESDIFNAVFCFVVSALVSYMLGSISFSIIFTKLFIKADVRNFGSGNAGMTNVLRTAGKLPAILTLLGDFLKAVAAIYFSRWLFAMVDLAYIQNSGTYIAGVFALIGHIKPLWFGFRGGKGVLTCAGIFFVLDPVLCTVCIAIFCAIAFITGYVSLGSIISMSSAPILTIAVGLTIRADYLSVPSVLWQTFFVFILASISVYMHKDNIKRLLNGTENSFKKKNKTNSADAENSK